MLSIVLSSIGMFAFLNWFSSQCILCFYNIYLPLIRPTKVVRAYVPTFANNLDMSIRGWKSPFLFGSLPFIVYV